MNPVINELRVARTFSKEESQVVIKPLEKISAVVYTREANESFYARGYVRKSTKPWFYLRFSTEARREEYVTSWVAKLVSREETKIAERAKKKAPHTLVKGSIIYCSWGYDQTQCNFYQVVSLKSKTMVNLRELAQMQVDDSHVKPVLDSFVGSEFAKRVNPIYNSVKISSCQTATPTDANTSHYSTPFGMGH